VDRLQHEEPGEAADEARVDDAPGSSRRQRLDPQEQRRGQ